MAGNGAFAGCPRFCVAGWQGAAGLRDASRFCVAGWRRMTLLRGKPGRVCAQIRHSLPFGGCFGVLPLANPSLPAIEGAERRSRFAKPSLPATGGAPRGRRAARAGVCGSREGAGCACGARVARAGCPAGGVQLAGACAGCTCGVPCGRRAARARAGATSSGCASLSPR